MCIDKPNNHRCIDHISLFETLSPAEKDKLFQCSHSYEFQKGEYIDDLPIGIYILTDGMLSQVNIQDNGQNHILNYYHDGAVIGENHLNQEENMLLFFAETDGKLCIIEKKDIQHIFQENSGHYYALLEKATRRITKLEQRIYTLSIKETTSRIAQTLLDLQQNQVIPYSHQQIADYCYISRETVTRKLAILVDEGYISIQRKKIYIIDQEGLQGLVK